MVKQFEISEPAATKDLALYAEMNPDALAYDFRQKCYHHTGGAFKFDHDIDQSLFALSGSQAIDQSPVYSARIPSFVGDSIKRQLSIELVSTITRCIHLKHRMTASYRSIGGGERIRYLAPLALIHDGLRWHIRCFDEQDKLFKDHNLSRFVSVQALGASSADLEDDPDWNRWVELHLAPHPNAQHPETVRLDYGMEDNSKAILLRSCLVGYFLRRWPVDYSDSAMDDPREHQLFLTNKQKLIDEGVTEWAFR